MFTLKPDVRPVTAPTLCFSTLGCVELELEEALALAKSYGLQAIELRGLGGTLDLPEYFKSRFGVPDRLAACFADHGVWPASMDASTSLAEAGDIERAELRALLPWATATGAGQVRVFDGGDTGSDAELRHMGLTLDWWDELDPSLPLAVETHDAIAQPHVLDKFLELYPKTRILWDTHHTWQAGNEGPAVTWGKLRGRTAHLHVKDSVRSGDGHLSVPPGAGSFPHRELMTALSRAPVVISLEWERYWHPEIGRIEPALSGFAALYSTLTHGRTT